MEQKSSVLYYPELEVNVLLCDGKRNTKAYNMEFGNEMNDDVRANLETARSRGMTVYSDDRIALVENLKDASSSGPIRLDAFIAVLCLRGRASVYDTYSIYEPWENPGYYSGILRFESGGKTFRIDRNFDKQNKKAELVCEDDGENLSIENGDLELLLGGMDLSGYDNTISVGQLKTRPDQSLAAALKEYATSCCASGNGDLRPEQAIQRLEEQKKTIDKEIREALYERQRQRETVEQEASFVWREIHRLEEEEEQIRERIRQAERTRREQGEHKRLVDEIRPAKWRIHPLEIVIFLIAIIYK